MDTKDIFWERKKHIGQLLHVFEDLYLFYELKMF